VLRTRRTAATPSSGFSVRSSSRDLTDGETTGKVGSAMTTAALTRDSSSAQLIGLAGAFAFIIFVVVLILPH
jgi:hypothetical protein